MVCANVCLRAKKLVLCCQSEWSIVLCSLWGSWWYKMLWPWQYWNVWCRVLARLLSGGAAPLGLSGAPLGSQWNAIMHHLGWKESYRWLWSNLLPLCKQGLHHMWTETIELSQVNFVLFHLKLIFMIIDLLLCHNLSHDEHMYDQWKRIVESASICLNRTTGVTRAILR